VTDQTPIRTARRKARRDERERAGIAVPPCPLCIHEHHVVGRNNDPKYVVDRCEKHHRHRHEVMRQAGVSLAPEPDPVLRIANSMRALAVHKREEAMSEADAFERWASELEQAHGKIQKCDE
jgi:hypothetical protein